MVEQFAEANTNKIAATLRSCFPAWYTKHFGEPEAEVLYKRILNAMIKKSLVEDQPDMNLRAIEKQINQGLVRLASECSLPPNQKDIIELCLRIDKLPDFETAWKEALEHQGKKSHPIITAAANAVGVFELRQATLDNFSLKERFRTQFIIKCRLFRAGKNLAENTYSLEHDSQKYKQQKCEKTLAELAELSWKEHDKSIQQRIAEQGISLNPQEARLQCLSMLGIKPRCKE